MYKRQVVYIAQTAEAAARIKEVLAANGFLTQTKTTNSKHGGVYEISVPLSEAEDADVYKRQLLHRGKRLKRFCLLLPENLW